MMFVTDLVFKFRTCIITFYKTDILIKIKNLFRNNRNGIIFSSAFLIKACVGVNTILL